MRFSVSFLARRAAVLAPIEAVRDGGLFEVLETRGSSARTTALAAAPRFILNRASLAFLQAFFAA